MRGLISPCSSTDMFKPDPDCQNHLAARLGGQGRQASDATPIPSKLPLSDRRRGLLRNEIMDFNRQWLAKPAGPRWASRCLMAYLRSEPEAALSRSRCR